KSPGEGPKVRIPFAPAASRSLQVDFAARVEWGRFCPAACVNCDVRKRRVDMIRPSLTPFSLSAIDAVPPGKMRTPRQLKTAHRVPRHATGLRSAGEESALLAPIERQIEFGQPRRGERDGVAALQDRIDQLRAQESEDDQAPDVAAGDAFPSGQLLQRSGAASGQLLKPQAAARDRFDQRRIAFRAMARLCSFRQHQLGFDAAPPEGDCRLEFDRRIARCWDSPAPYGAGVYPDGEHVVVNDHLLDEFSDDDRSLPSRAAEPRSEPAGAS